MQKEVLKEAKLKKQALKVSIQEGSAASFSNGIATSYLTPYALALNASPFHIGILSSFSGLLSPIAQFFGSKLIGRFHRKKIVLTFVFLQALTWLPIGVLAFLYLQNIITNSSIYILISLYALNSIFTGLAYPAWFSWMGDIVPVEHRGRYFSKRNIVVGVIEIIAVIIGLGILRTFEAKNIALLGLGILFILASLFRFVSYILFHKQYSPYKFKLDKHYNFSVSDFLKTNQNFKKFGIYYLFINLAIMIASPFFAVYMLDKSHLAFNYTQFIIVSLSSSVFYLISLPVIGKFSDKFGNIRLLHMGSFLFALNPILWIIFKSLPQLIFVQFISGLANAAIVIGVTNFSYDSVKPEQRGTGIAYSNIMAGIGIFIGSLIGGFLLNYEKILNIEKFIFVFALAAILRLLVTLILLPKIKEEKKSIRLPPLHVNILHPFKGIYTEIGVLSGFIREFEEEAESLKVATSLRKHVFQKKVEKK